MLFSEAVACWEDWARVFQRREAFTPLAREIFRREGLPFAPLSPLTPGTNGVFRSGEWVVKIFFPREAGLDPAPDFAAELAASRQAAQWGVPTPAVAAHGVVADRYAFHYLITEYSPGKEAGPWLAGASPRQRGGFVESLQGLLACLHRPAHALPRRDLVEEARRNPRLAKLSPSLRGQVLARLEGLDLGELVLTHGDLTGENLLVKEDGSLTLLDWADARLAPGWYELGPIAFELFAGDGALWKLFAGGRKAQFAARLLDCCCLHGFGPDFLTGFASRQGLPPFASLGEAEAAIWENLG